MLARRGISSECKLRIGRNIDLLRAEFPKLVDRKLPFEPCIYSKDVFFKAELVQSISPITIQGREKYFTFLKFARLMISAKLKHRNMEIVKMSLVTEKNVMVHWRLSGYSRNFISASRKQVYEGYSILHFDEEGILYRHAVNNIIPPPKITQSMKALLWWWQYWTGQQRIQLN